MIFAWIISIDKEHWEIVNNWNWRIAICVFLYLSVSLTFPFHSTVNAVSVTISSWYFAVHIATSLWYSVLL